MKVDFSLASIEVGDSNRNVHGLTEGDDLNLLHFLVQRFHLATHKRLHRLPLGLEEGSVEIGLLLQVARADQPSKHHNGVGAGEVAEIALQLLLRHVPLFNFCDPQQGLFEEHLDRVLLIPAGPLWLRHPPIEIFQRLPHSLRFLRLPQGRFVDGEHVGPVEAVPVPAHDPHGLVRLLDLLELAQEDFVVLSRSIEGLQRREILLGA
mmetsp:Transcript_30678/g.98712  ORF Transcript_30678/g.98712 Transcript_30678/m.98712 type:complete len:207 (+) Transcript_30678:210-830(+)